MPKAFPLPFPGAPRTVVSDKEITRPRRAAFTNVIFII
jgi:hypothetical protein